MQRQLLYKQFPFIFRIIRRVGNAVICVHVEVHVHFPEMQYCQQLNNTI